MYLVGYMLFIIRMIQHYFLGGPCKETQHLQQIMTKLLMCWEYKYLEVFRNSIIQPNVF